MGSKWLSRNNRSRCRYGRSDLAPYIIHVYNPYSLQRLDHAQSFNFNWAWIKPLLIPMRIRVFDSALHAPAARSVPSNTSFPPPPFHSTNLTITRWAVLYVTPVSNYVAAKLRSNEWVHFLYLLLFFIRFCDTLHLQFMICSAESKNAMQPVFRSFELTSQDGLQTIFELKYVNSRFAGDTEANELKLKPSWKLAWSPTP